MRRRLVGVEPGEIDGIARGNDRSRRHHRLAGARGHATKVITSVRMADQIPGVAFEAALAGVGDPMAFSNLGGWRNPRLQSNQELVLSLGVADLRHVVIRGYYVA